VTPTSHNLFSAFFGPGDSRYDRPLMITPAGTQYAYRHAIEESARLARLFSAMGLRAGDRVTAQVPKSPQAVWLYLACLRAGLVFHPLNDAYRPEEIAYLLADAEPRLAVCHPRMAGQFAALAPGPCHVLTLDEQGAGSLTGSSRDQDPDFSIVARDASDVAVLLYTSGTTGKPKGAMITHGNLAANARALVAAWEFTAEDRLLHALPIFHAHGLFVGLGCTLLSGASMVFLPQFAIDTVASWLPRCSVMMGVPTYYTRLLASGRLDRENCAHVRVFISGSAPLMPETFAAFRQRTGHAILERYGMTETGMNTSNPLHGERRPGSVGLPLAGVTVRVTDTDDRPLPVGSTGEIQVRGANVFAGYWRLPEKSAEAFTADGFFRTGDLGWLSEDGYLTIAGRSKDLIITGGLNVYPREVENVIDSLPEIAESAVIGVPHPDFGEAVVAVVVATPGTTPDADQIRRSLRDRLASYKLPKRVAVVGELPRNAMGKVDKAALRRRFAEVAGP
jgi:malonyl-CoA/methylmalonyl-CoA synthetase